MRDGSCIHSFLAFELASLLLELVLGPMPLSWGLLRNREGAFESQPAEEGACVAHCPSGPNERVEAGTCGARRPC